MKKKIILGTVIGFMALFTLSACGKSEDIATMKGGKITSEEFYEKAKTQDANQQLVATMIINKVFEDKYGKKVTDEDVNKAYKEQEEQSGGADTFKQVLTNYGYTEATFKEALRTNLVLEAGFKANMKITDDDLKTVWETYHPEVSAQIIKVDSEEDANKIVEELKNGGDFTTIAKEKSTDTATKEDGGKIKFDSTNTSVPDEVKEAAYKLKDDAVSEVIPVTVAAQTYGASSTTSYYIVKMITNKAKGNDMKPYKDELTKIAEEQKLKDQTFQYEVVGKELEEAKVDIKDDAFKTVLDSYLPKTEDSSTESSKSSDSSKEASSEESSSDKTTESSSK